jgi:ribonuclease HII
MTRVEPDLQVETGFAAQGVRLLAACDEVGRGAVAGPVSVGLVVLDLRAATLLPGVADSKLLRAAQREELAPQVRAWALASAVGHAHAQEVEEFGIVTALRLAGMRALEQVGTGCDAVLLDGSHDWLTPPAQDSLFGAPRYPDVRVPQVTTRVKADRDCTSVAAASVIAKVERDSMMRELDTRYPGYDLAGNAGYGTPAHLAACRRLGASPEHRASWITAHTSRADCPAER